MIKTSVCIVCCFLLASCHSPSRSEVTAPATPLHARAEPRGDGCVPAGISVDEGFVTSVDGTRIHFRKLGRGRPRAIYLHGGPGASMYNGGCELAELARDVPFVLYDQRGGGRSELVSEAGRLRVEDHVADLDAVRRHFELDQVALIGLSWGSALAIAYADAHPGRVSRLLLLSPMPVAKSPFGDARGTAVAKAAGPGVMERRQELSRQLNAASSPEEVIGLCRKLLREVPLPYSLQPGRHRSPNACDFPADVILNRAIVSRHTLQSLGDWDFRPALRRTRVPVLVVEGARTVVPLSSTELWAASAPQGRLLLVPDAGHEVGLDQPEALRILARTFVGGRWPAGSSRWRHGPGSG